jgi:hypothetical protein
VLLLAAPAVAQNRAAEIDFENALRESLEKAQKAAADAKAVDEALAMIRDTGGMSATVIDRYDELGAKVVVRAQAESSKTTIEEGRTVISLSDALPRLKVAYAAMIAYEIGKSMHADMPACAERSYMARGVAGLVWLELYGDPAKLPVIDPFTGAQVPAVYDVIGSWASEGAEMALYKISEAESLPRLPEMMEGKSGAELETLEAANKRFVAFRINESAARRLKGVAKP